MPELPEVEVVRRGLEAHVVGHTIADVEVLHPRAVRRHLPGSLDLAGRLEGQTVVGAERRGKYLWLVLEPSSVAIVVHLGMSGQMLVQDPTVPDEKHLRIRARLESGIDLRFVDNGPSVDGRWPTSSPSTAPSCRTRSRTSPAIRSIRVSIPISS